MRRILTIIVILLFISACGRAAARECNLQVNPALDGLVSMEIIEYNAIERIVTVRIHNNSTYNLFPEAGFVLEFYNARAREWQVIPGVPEAVTLPGILIGQRGGSHDFVKSIDQLNENMSGLYRIRKRVYTRGHREHLEPPQPHEIVAEFYRGFAINSVDYPDVYCYIYGRQAASDNNEEVAMQVVGYRIWPETYAISVIVRIYNNSELTIETSGWNFDLEFFNEEESIWQRRPHLGLWNGDSHNIEPGRIAEMYQLVSSGNYILDPETNAFVYSPNNDIPGLYRIVRYIYSAPHRGLSAPQDCCRILHGHGKLQLLERTGGRSFASCFLIKPLFPGKLRKKRCSG